MMTSNDIRVVTVLGLALWCGQFFAGPSPALDARSKSAAADFSYHVDVNAASEAELLHVTGIGETLARRIVDSRAVDGPFETVDDLLRIKGIGVKTLANFSAQICCHPPDKSSPRR